NNAIPESARTDLRLAADNLDRGHARWRVDVLHAPFGGVRRAAQSAQNKNGKRNTVHCDVILGSHMTQPNRLNRYAGGRGDDSEKPIPSDIVHNTADTSAP